MDNSQLKAILIAIIFTMPDIEDVQHAEAVANEILKIA